MVPELFQRLALALAIGLLVGIERGWHARGVAEGGRTAGIRTYALMGLLGGVAGLLGQRLGGWAFAAVAVPFAAAFILFKYDEQRADGDHSVTALIAGLLVFALGAYAMVGDGRLAGAAAVVTASLLAFKAMIHTWLEKLTWPELRSALILLAMTFVALPLLPDQRFGPYGAVNPRELWMLTIALAGVSFLAYAAIKIFGASRGVLVASAAGALVSSTAVTLQLARMSREEPEGTMVRAGAALLAGGVMAMRLLAITAALSPTLSGRMAPPLVAFVAVSLLICLVVLRFAPSKPQAEAETAVKSPLDFGLVIKFALLLAVVMAAARILVGMFGSKGLLLFAGFAGLADADAATLTMARMNRDEGLGVDLAASAILLSAGVNSLSKAVIATVVGGPKFGAAFAAGTAVAAAAAAGTLFWMARGIGL